MLQFEMCLEVLRNIKQTRFLLLNHILILQHYFFRNRVWEVVE